MTTGSPARIGKDGITLAIRLTPKAARDAVTGLIDAPEGVRLAVSVRAVADKGAANAAAEACIARWLDIAKSSVRLASGGKSRYKALTISGEPAGLMARIAGKIADLA